MIVDARGLTCPAPVLRCARAARDAPAGTVLVVLWTDPAAAVDLPAWARMRGHAVVPPPPGVLPADEPAHGTDGTHGVTAVRLR